MSAPVGCPEPVWAVLVCAADLAITLGVVVPDDSSTSSNPFLPWAEAAWSEVAR